MTRLVKLRRLGYRTAFGALRAYWFLARPEMDGVKCVITDRGRLLLVRHTYGPRVWDLPGGGVKRGEAPLTAARREMREELGLIDAPWGALGEIRGRVHYRHETVQVFTAELAGPELLLDYGELAEARFFACRELPSDLGPYVTEIVAQVPWLEGSSPPP